MSRVFIGQFKGAKGETGDRGIKGDKGEKGDKGDRGSRITRGTAITGTSTNGTKFPNSGISDAKNHDYYINENTGNLYECIVPGNADTAEWAHAGSFKGPKGDTGPAGSISNINEQKPTYTEAAVLTNISSGETVKIAFGKLKKALSVLMTHYVQQATASVLGHVKLSNSAAVTQTGQMALDAVEKNASVAGTLANQISQVNSNLTAEWLENGYDIFTTTAPIKLYKTNQNRIPKQTFPNGLNPYGTIVVFARSEYPFALYFSAQEEFAVNYNRSGWKRFSLDVEGTHNYKLGFDNNGIYVTVDTTKFYLQTK